MATKAVAVTTTEGLGSQAGEDEARSTVVHGLGELSLGLIREWGPVLKPTGVGLLTTIHAWEEQNPRNPFYGWMHVAQEALAAYLDMGRTSIIRYRNLLDTCGLVEQREVSYRRPGMKLHQTVLRTTRAEVKPSLYLLEYLIFDADEWTRKHTAWLLASYQPVGEDSELGRLVATMRRAYQVKIGGSGLATIIDGERLTPAGSFAERLMQRALAEQPQLLEVADFDQQTKRTGESAGQLNGSIVSPVDNAAMSSQTLAVIGTTNQAGTVSSGVTPLASDVSSRVGAAQSTVSSGVNLNVNDVLLVNQNELTTENVNVASSNEFAIASKGAGLIDDAANLGWHLLCVSRMGQRLYGEAIAATQRVIASGKLRGKPGQYFTRTAKQLAAQQGIALSKTGEAKHSWERSVPPVDNGASPQVGADGEDLASNSELRSDVPPVDNGAAMLRYDEPGMAARQAWQAVMAELEERLQGLAWFGWLRHARLLALEGDKAVVGTPSSGLAERMAQKHGAEVGRVFSAVLGRQVDVEFVTRW